MKAIIVYYSGNNQTKDVAKLIGGLMLKNRNRAQVKYETIQPLKEEGTIKKIIMATFKREVPILNADLDVSGYDIIIIVSPVFGVQAPPAVNSYLVDINGVKGKKTAAFVITSFGSGNAALKSISSVLTKRGGKFVSGTGMLSKDISEGLGLKNKVRDFVKKILK
ncbi:MAG: hypothetical protein QME45_03680 [Clostridiales bacterium]|nr:hypothetical protein [Clostridiales bacterium]HBM80873.1 hypothetical protein [Clostridiaceae bacterium]